MSDVIAGSESQQGSSLEATSVQEGGTRVQEKPRPSFLDEMRRNTQRFLEQQLHEQNVAQVKTDEICTHHREIGYYRGA
jgi:archaellum component FlaC